MPVLAFGGDGTTPHYILREQSDFETPTFPGASVINSILQTSAQSRGYRIDACSVWTTDAIFRETPDAVTRWQATGAAQWAMETASLYCLANLYGMHCGAILAISDKPGSEYDLMHTNRVHDRLLESLKKQSIQSPLPCPRLKKSELQEFFNIDLADLCVLVILLGDCKIDL